MKSPLAALRELLSGPSQRRSGNELREQVARQAELIEQQNKRLQELTAQVDRVLHRPLVHDEPEATPLERILHRYDQRLTSLNQAHTRHRQDLVPSEFLAHDTIARQFDHFVTQDLYDAAMELVETRPDNPGLATTMHHLSISLFDKRLEGLSAAEIRDRLVQRDVPISASALTELLAIAQELKAHASGTGHRHEWALDARLGEPVDDRSQRPWEGDDPHGLVRMVVAPGYVVEQNRVYVKQLVATRSIDTAASTA